MDYVPDTRLYGNKQRNLKTVKQFKQILMKRKILKYIGYVKKHCVVNIYIFSRHVLS